MSNSTRDYLLYLSIGLNVALFLGMFYVGVDGMQFGSDGSVLPAERWTEYEEDEFEEWREFESRMTKLERETRPLRIRIAREQKNLLEALKEPGTDTSTIRSIHDRIHEYQRNLQNRTLKILLEQRRTLSRTSRRRVFNRLLDRHQRRYRDLHLHEGSEDSNEDAEEYEEYED